MPKIKYWSQKENRILQKYFAEARKEKLLKLLPNRSWLAILAHGERKIVDDLKKLGVSYRKSSQIARVKIPKIPKKYLRDFIRGIVDGDGSINFDKRGYPTLSICGRKEIITFIRNHFFSKFNIYSKITRGKKNGKLMNLFYICYRTNSAKTLINYLYQNADLCLERKFQLAQIALMKKIKPRKNYTKKEDEIIKKFYHCLPKEKILFMLPRRNWLSIQNRACYLGITKNKRRKKKL